MERQQIIEILKKYKKEKGIEYGIRKIGFFGSYARGTATENSDLDIVIELEKPDMFLMVHIKEELEKILMMKVDLIRNRPNINSYLKRHLQKEAIYA